MQSTPRGPKLSVIALALNVALATFIPAAVMAATYTDVITLGGQGESLVIGEQDTHTIGKEQAVIIDAAASNAMLTNKGTISATSVKPLSGNQYNSTNIMSFGHIKRLDNSGTLSSKGGQLSILGEDGKYTNNNNGYAYTIFAAKGNIETLNNTGSIDSTSTGTAKAIISTTTIKTINNLGSIKASAKTYSTAKGYALSNEGKGTIAALNNGAQGEIIGSGSSLGQGINNNGTITTLENSGKIQGEGTGITEVMLSGTMQTGNTTGTGDGIYNSGTIGTLANSGLVYGNGAGKVGKDGTGAGSGINNMGGKATITMLENKQKGNISGSTYGIYNAKDAKITTLKNAGTIQVVYQDGKNKGILEAAAINNQGDINTLSNSGAISINSLGAAGLLSYRMEGIANSGKITALNNRGKIAAKGNGKINGISNKGEVGTLTNTGMITTSTQIGAAIGIDNSGTISTLTNHGTITAAGGGGEGSGDLTDGIGTGIKNAGSITLLDNAKGGVIAGKAGDGGGDRPLVIYNTKNGKIDKFVNAGAIRGDIVNEAAHDLVIAGGQGAHFGILTGGKNKTTTASNIGKITNKTSNVVFAGGNQLLNDDIDVGTKCNWKMNLKYYTLWSL